MTEILQPPEPYSKGYHQVGFRSYDLHGEENPQPPVFSSLDEFEQGGQDVTAHFRRTPWLSPPKPEGPDVKKAEASPAQRDPASRQEYTSGFQPVGLTEDCAKTLIKLSAWRAGKAGSPESGPAKCFAEALKEFSCSAARFDDQCGAALRSEFQRLIEQEMDQRSLEEGHLESLLLAFGATRNWGEELSSSGKWPSASSRQAHLQQADSKAMRVRRCVQTVVRDILHCMQKRNPDATNKWKQFRVAEIRDPESDLYGYVDVRCWPLICELLKVDVSTLSGEAVCRQIQLQMCAQGTTRPMKYQWLLQAAALIDSLKLQEKFDEVAAVQEVGMWQMGIYTTFNDKMLSVHERREVLHTILKDAPQTLIRKVLANLDEDIDETERKEDYELRMLHDLLDDLDQDIRRCDKAFFRLKRNWISSFDHLSGVIENEELTPAQFCDHIEDDPMYEILLKDAVNRLLRLTRTFEAAKMLARPKAVSTKAAANIKDAQVLYIKSLYEQEKEPEDLFAPMAQGSLRLPAEEESVLRVPSTTIVEGEVQVTNDALAVLQHELLRGPPVALGIWWLWRCFNARLDQHSRAAVLALTYQHPGRPTRLVLVDMIALEKARSAEEQLHKEVLSQILNAPHILKVVHFLERTALRALQLALVTEDVRQGPTKPSSYVSITPCVDVALVTAYLQGTSGVHRNETSSLAWDFMRLDMCLTEALSNFERRPLRKTQEHYALSLAYVPLALLRALCSFGKTDWRTVLSFCMKIHGGAIGNWDEDLFKVLNFGDFRRGAGDPAAFNPENEFAFVGNIWEVESSHIESGATEHLHKLGLLVHPRDSEQVQVFSSRMPPEGSGASAEQVLDLLRNNGLQVEDYPLRVVNAQGKTEFIQADRAEQRLEALLPPPRAVKTLIYTAQKEFLTYNQAVEKHKNGALLSSEFPLKAFYLKHHKEIETLIPERGGDPELSGLKAVHKIVTDAHMALSVDEQSACCAAVYSLYDIEAASAEMEALQRDILK